MRHRNGLIGFAMLAGALFAAAPANAATGSAQALAEAQILSAPRAKDDLPPIRPMSDGEKQAAGCILSSAATMSATYLAGPSEVIMLVVGGLIVPSSSSVLFVALMGTMASMACGAGAAITPAVLWALRKDDPDTPAAH